MTRPHTLLLSSTLLAVCVLGFAPSSHALSLNASLGLPAAPAAQAGGGNALTRVNSGGSQGLTRASPTSGLLGHLTFASTRGGRLEETPPANENSNTGGSTSTDQSDGADGSTGSPQASSNGAPAGGANGNSSNGGATAGNGGNGGDGGGASPGGWVRAGGAGSNSNSVNMINVTIIKIGR